jgi:pSer/pThr/pTyr-binding forkhead associated (FHA) protein
VLNPGANVLGRDAGATVVIDHGSVSRRHARVLVRETGAFVEDLQSRNGTFVNGKAIDGLTELHDGDVVALGPVSLVIERISGGGSTETAPRQ